MLKLLILLIKTGVLLITLVEKPVFIGVSEGIDL